MRTAPLFFLALLLGCTSTASTDDDDATSDLPEDWTLEIRNDSATSFDVLMQRPCPSTDPDDYNELALPAGGLAPDDFWRWLLPTPGCFALHLEGDGCLVDASTDPLQLSEQFVWTVTDADLLCQGG